ncbi:MAG: hypothetical protein L3J02_02115, partial [Henriciella sp.]|nr:hypothetical protein [Henriciella sp.]
MQSISRQNQSIKNALKSRVSPLATACVLAFAVSAVSAGSAMAQYQAQSSDDGVASDDVVIPDDDAARRFAPITVTARKREESVETT